MTAATEKDRRTRPKEMWRRKSTSRRHDESGRKRIETQDENWDWQERAHAKRAENGGMRTEMPDEHGTQRIENTTRIGIRKRAHANTWREGREAYRNTRRA